MTTSAGRQLVGGPPISSGGRRSRGSRTRRLCGYVMARRRPSARPPAFLQAADLRRPSMLDRSLSANMAGGGFRLEPGLSTTVISRHQLRADSISSQAEYQLTKATRLATRLICQGCDRAAAKYIRCRFLSIAHFLRRFTVLCRMAFRRILNLPL